MALGKRLINTGGAEAACNTETTDIFGDLSGVALWSLDYDGTETSGSHDMIPEPEPIFGVGGKINTGVRFSENTNGLRNTSLQLNSTAHSVSVWMKPQDITSGQNQTVFFSAFSGHPYFILGKRFDQSTSFHYRNETGSELYFTLPNADVWYHVVVTRTNGSCKIYVNGSFVTSNTDAMGTYGSSGYQYTAIGALPHSSYPNEYFVGDVDQVRVFNRVLLTDNNGVNEIATLYAETACVHTSTTDIVNYPTGTTPVAYYKLDNSSEDYSTGGNDGTDTNVEYRFGRFGQAAVFNGSSSKIDLGNNSSNNSSVISVSLWFKTAGHSGTAALINNGGANSGETGYYLGLNSNGTIKFEAGTGTVNGAVNYADSNWHQVVLTLNSGAYNIYVDGNTTPVITGSGAFTSTATRPTWIGQFSYTASNLEFFNGSIDQVRIFGSALSASNVTDLYNEKPEVDTSNFKAVLYEGNGGSQYISNVGFEPDLVWIKERTGSAWHILTDSVRGANKTIYSNDTYQEESLTNVMNSFESNGFTVGYNSAYSSVFSNRNNEDYVAWVLKGGGEAVNIGVNTITGSTPSIASDVSANTAAGFSIVKYTGNSTSGATVGHSLDSSPEIIMVKNLDANSTGWIVKIPSVMTDDKDFIYLNDSAAISTAGSTTFIKTVNSSIFTLGTSSQTNSTDDFIAYCWHSVAGYSKIGSYSGSGASGNAQSVGFAPSFVVVKSTSGSTSNWSVFDNPRTGERLNWNTNGAGSSDTRVTLTSTGFEFTGSAFNNSGVDWLYMAFK